MTGRIDHLFVQSTTEVGGAETVLLNLFAHGAELRRRAAVALLQFGRGELGVRLRDAGARVYELPTPRLRNPLGVLAGVEALARLGRRLGARTFVGNGAHPQVFGSLAARTLGVSSVYVVHGPIHAPLAANHPIDVLALRGACRLQLANSRATEAILDALGLGTEVRRLPLGTPIRPVPPAQAQAARRELGVRPGELLFGVFGRFQRWKGQDVYLRAAARLPRSLRVRHVIVGDVTFGLEADYGAELRALPAALGIGDRVHFTGFRSDVARWMAACDLVCQPSRGHEPFGMVLIEALAQGRPVVGTRTGGPEEIIEPGRTGLLVAPDDAEALAAALATLAADPTRRRRMEEAARTSASTRFSAEAMSARMIAELDRVAGEGAR